MSFLAKSFWLNRLSDIAVVDLFMVPQECQKLRVKLVNVRDSIPDEVSSPDPPIEFAVRAQH